MASSRGEVDAYAVAAARLDGYNAFVDIPKRVCVVGNLNSAGEKWVRGCQTNHVFVIRNCSDVNIYVVSNQRVHTFYLINCRNIYFTLMDSVVIANRTVRAFNCEGCTFVFEDVDVRRFECYNVNKSQVVVMHSPPVVDNAKIYWRNGSSNNSVQLGKLLPRGTESKNTLPYEPSYTSPALDAPQGGESISSFNILQQPFHSTYMTEALPNPDDILRELQELEDIPFTLTNDELSAAYDREREEIEEPLDSVREKVKEVVKILQNAKHTVCYTGAGVSTSANIPDFRGPQGIWTLKAKGVSPVGKFSDDDEIRPTATHYGITELARRNLINFVITTNMDALHLRSGLPRHLICEQHGNGNKEVCVKCRKAFYRQYSVSYSTDFFTHFTDRACDFCGGNLRDTIVNFSENLADEDMHTSIFQAMKSDAALVLGTSMNVQPAASFPDKCFRNNGKMVIVNLQKTPYDSAATVRIFAKTDVFMKILFEELGINDFDTSTDVLPTWDFPTPDTPMPAAMRRKFEQSQKSEWQKKLSNVVGYFYRE